jgi:hypothetical protein
MGGFAFDLTTQRMANTLTENQNTLIQQQQHPPPPPAQLVLHLPDGTSHARPYKMGVTVAYVKLDVERTFGALCLFCCRLRAALLFWLLFR